MGAAASLILILRPLIQKLPDIACRLSGNKKALGQSQGYHELPPYTAETVHYLCAFFCLNLNSERQKKVALLQQVSVTSFQALPLPSHIYVFYGSPGDKFLTSDQ